MSFYTIPLYAFLTVFGALAGSPSLAATADDCAAFETGEGGSPVIQALIQGQGPFEFVLDTASSGTTVNAETATHLGLKRDAEREIAEGMGGPMDTRLYRVPSLTAGPLALTDFAAPGIPAPALESHDIVGLAGVDLFGDVLAVWNKTPGCVTVVASGMSPGQDHWRPVDVRWIRPWKIMLPIRIGGVQGWGLLDTGAQKTIINQIFADRLGLTPASGRLVDGGEISGIDGRPLPLFLSQVEDVAVGEWRWERRTLRIGDPPVFARLGDPETPLAVIGADWLADQSFAIDYGTKAVWQNVRSPGGSNVAVSPPR